MDEFLDQTPEIVLTDVQKRLVSQFLPIQAKQFMQQTRFSRSLSYVPPSCAGFTFVDAGTGEMYFLPIDTEGIGFFFVKVSDIELHFYSLRYVHAA